MIILGIKLSNFRFNKCHKKKEIIIIKIIIIIIIKVALLLSAKKKRLKGGFKRDKKQRLRRDCTWLA